MVRVAFVAPSTELLEGLLSLLLGGERRMSEEFEVYVLRDGTTVQVWAFKPTRRSLEVLRLMLDTFSRLFLLFDLEDERSLDEAVGIARSLGVGERAVLVGGFRDFSRAMPLERGAGAARELGASYVEVSMKSGENMDIIRDLMLSGVKVTAPTRLREEAPPVARPALAVRVRGEVKLVPVALGGPDVALTGEEARVYELCTGELSIEEIAERLSMPRLGVAMVVRRLERRGLVRVVRAIF